MLRQTWLRKFAKVQCEILWERAWAGLGLAQFDLFKRYAGFLKQEFAVALNLQVATFLSQFSKCHEWLSFVPTC